MPIVRRSKVERHIVELRSTVDALVAVLQDRPAAGNTWNHYALNPDDFARDFVEVDVHALGQALATLKATTDAIKKLEKHREAKIGAPR